MITSQEASLFEGYSQRHYDKYLMPISILVVLLIITLLYLRVKPERYTMGMVKRVEGKPYMFYKVNGKTYRHEMTTNTSEGKYWMYYAALNPSYMNLDHKRFIPADFYSLNLYGQTFKELPSARSIGLRSCPMLFEPMENLYFGKAKVTRIDTLNQHIRYYFNPDYLFAELTNATAKQKAWVIGDELEVVYAIQGFKKEIPKASYEYVPLTALKEGYQFYVNQIYDEEK